MLARYSQEKDLNKKKIFKSDNNKIMLYDLDILFNNKNYCKKNRYTKL